MQQQSNPMVGSKELPEDFKNDFILKVKKCDEQVGSQNKVAKTIKTVSSPTLSNIMNGRWETIKPLRLMRSSLALDAYFANDKMAIDRITRVKVPMELEVCISKIVNIKDSAKKAEYLNLMLDELKHFYAL